MIDFAYRNDHTRDAPASRCCVPGSKVSIAHGPYFPSESEAVELFVVANAASWPWPVCVNIGRVVGTGRSPKAQRP